MTLTVPTAGSNAGRSAQGQLAAPSGGKNLAAFGSQMNAIGKQVETDFLRREAQRFTVDLTRDLNNLSLEVDQIGDPDLAARTWSERSEELKNDYLNTPNETGVVRVSQGNSDRFGLVYDQLHNRHSYAIGARAVATRQAEYQSNILSYRHEALGQINNADPDRRAVLIGQYSDMLDDMVQANILNPLQRKQLELEFLNDAEKIRATGLITSDPQGYLDADEAGDFNGMDAGVRAQRRAQAQGNLNRANAAALKEAEAAEKKVQTETSDRLGDIVDVVTTGMTSDDISFLETEQAQSNPDYAQTMAAVALANEQPDLSQMSPRELQSLIDQEQKTPVRKKYQTERLTFLEDLKAKAEKGYESDPIDYAETSGLIVPDLPDFDPSNPNTFAKGLAEREQFSAHLQERGFSDSDQILTDAERTKVKDLVAPETDPAERLAMAQSLALAFGDTGGERAVQFGADPVFGRVVDLIGLGAPKSTARLILAGQTKLAQKTITAPSRAQAIERFHDTTQGVFQDQPALTQSVLGAAIAIYAEENPVEADGYFSGKTGELDEDKFSGAIQRALGAQEDRSGKLSVGGLQPIDVMAGDFLLPLPQGVSRHQVEAGLDALSPIFSTQEPDAEGLRRGAWKTPRQALINASLSNSTPELGDDRDIEDLWGDLKLMPYWPDGQQTDRYVLYRDRNDRRSYILDSDGAVFQFSLKTLLSGAVQ